MTNVFGHPALETSSIQCCCVVSHTGWCSVERLWSSCWRADVSATLMMLLMTWFWECVSMLYEFLSHTVPSSIRYTHTNTHIHTLYLIEMRIYHGPFFYILHIYQFTNILLLLLPTTTKLGLDLQTGLKLVAISFLTDPAYVFSKTRLSKPLKIPWAFIEGVKTFIQ